jgi:hypothetical protein
MEEEEDREEKLIDISKLPIEVQFSIRNYEININVCGDVQYLQDEINRLVVLRYTKMATATSKLKGFDINQNMEVNELPLQMQFAIRDIELKVNSCFDIEILQTFSIKLNREVHVRNVVVQKLIGDWTRIEENNYSKLEDIND